jgi:hypothetical protein
MPSRSPHPDAAYGAMRRSLLVPLAPSSALERRIRWMVLLNHARQRRARAASFVSSRARHAAPSTGSTPDDAA